MGNASTTECPVLTDEELAALDATFGFKPPDEEKKRAIFESAHKKLQDFDMGSACAVCQMMFSGSGIIPVVLSPLLLKSMQQHLKPPEAVVIPPAILEQYSVGALNRDLEGLLLYPPAISVHQNRTRVSMCQHCHDCLNKPRSTLPRMAIANGNYIGWYEDSQNEEVRWLEEQMVALVSPCVSVTTVSGGKSRCIRSHHYVVRNTAGPLVSMLPHEAASRVRVTMVGAMTPAQVAKCRKRYQIDIPRCQRALQSLLQTHSSFANPEIRATAEDYLTRCHPVDIVDDQTSNSNAAISQNVVDTMDDTTSYAIPDTLRVDEDDVETEWIEDRTVLLDESTQPNDFIYRKSNDFVDSRRWEAVTDMFPLLLPGGCGGPSEPRKRQYSLSVWINRCLRLAGNRFERHEVFVLLAFDCLAFEAARQRMFIRLNTSLEAVHAGGVSQEVIAECLAYRQSLEQAAASGTTLPTPSEQVKAVLNLNKGVTAGQVAYYGSNQGRAQARNDIFGYISRLGPLQLFFTVSPDSSGNYTIGRRAGLIDPATITRANAHLLPNRTKRREISGRHPYQCALYFDHVVSTVIEDVLGWSQQKGRPKKGGGLFGVVRAFAASAETQVSGDLHAHFAVWLHGFPTQASSMDEQMANEAFAERLKLFIDGITTAHVPGITSHCLKTPCNGLVEPMPIDPKAYMKQKKGEPAVPTAKCNACQTTYHSDELISALISDDMTASELDYIKCHTPDREYPSREDLVVIVRGVQVHYSQHTASCFKATRRTPTGTVCRFLRPVPANDGVTTFDDNQDVVHGRPVGCEYVNPYNETLALLLRCNHDVRFVLASTSRDVAAYICKYIMKPQNTIENNLAFSLGAFCSASTRVHDATRDEELTDREKGNKILAKTLFAVTNQQEVAASLAALFILRKSAFWYSHEVVRISLTHLIQTLTQADANDATVLVSPEVLARAVPVYEYVNAVQNYWQRPKAMEQLCLVDVLETFDIAAGTFKKRDQPRILVLCGKKLPDIDDELSTEDREFYFQSMVLLFKPTRRSAVLHPGCTYEQTFHHFKDNGPRRAVSLASEFSTTLKDSFQSARSAQSQTTPEDSIMSRYSPAAGLVMDPPQVENCEDPIETVADLLSSIPSHQAEEQRLRSTISVLDSDPVLRDAIFDIASKQIQPAFRPARRSTDADISMQEGIETCTDNVGTTRFLETFTTTETRLERIREYHQPVPWIDPASVVCMQPDSLPQFASISQVSLAYTLNLWQHVAFETAARHVLYSYAQDIADSSDMQIPLPSESSNIHPQLIGFLGGEAGTGKSAVIHALLKFADVWGRPGSVETLAFTGVAAINVKGRTIHSARNIPVPTTLTNSPSDEMRTKFASVVLTIVDEISMTDQILLGRADVMSRDMGPPHLQKPWGGKHLLLCGDWFQIHPVRGTPCFRRSAAARGASKRAQQLYSQINFVVFLIENMRSRTDPEYTAILSRLRLGRLSDDDISTLNSRVHQPTSRDSTSPWYFKPVIVPINTLRCAVNLHATFQSAALAKIPVFQCAARPTARRSFEAFEKVKNLDDSCTDRVPFKFFYFIGMPVMVTQRTESHPNVAANGTLAFIAGHELPQNPTWETHRMEGCEVRLLAEQPLAIYLKIAGRDDQFDETLPRGVLAIRPQKISVKISIPRPAAQVVTGKRKRKADPTMTVMQFPVVAAFACTPEKLQGLTCTDGVTLTYLLRGKDVTPPTLYVALSRTVSLQKLTLTHELDRSYVQRFRPKAETISEVRRLLAKITLPTYISEDQLTELNTWRDSYLAL